MKTASLLIRQARLKKKYTLSDLERETKIKKQFISAIERAEWEKLPEFPVVAGFIKNLSSALNLDRNQLVSILRRDYPPERIKEINPKKPEIKKGFRWNPKFSFILLSSILVAVSVGYLIFQYVKFTSPPKLVVINPTENQEVKGNSLIIKGQTDPEDTIVANNQSMIVKDDGAFLGEIEISETTKEIEIIARSRSGKETIIHRKIVLK